MSCIKGGGGGIRFCISHLLGHALSLSSDLKFLLFGNNLLIEVPKIPYELQ